MKIEIDALNSKQNIPKVGDVFKRKNGKTLYVRIDDKQGKLACQHTGLWDNHRIIYVMRLDNQRITYISDRDSKKLEMVNVKIVLDE